jgi:hypothetical protein
MSIDKITFRVCAVETWGQDPDSLFSLASTLPRPGHPCPLVNRARKCYSVSIDGSGVASAGGRFDDWASARQQQHGQHQLTCKLAGKSTQASKQARCKHSPRDVSSRLRLAPSGRLHRRSPSTSRLEQQFTSVSAVTHAAIGSQGRAAWSHREVLTVLFFAQLAR